MSRGNITRRSKQSWRIKFDLPSDGGDRQTRYVTVRGKYADAQRELTKLLSAADNGMDIEPRKVTVADYMKAWLDGRHNLSPKTVERYKQLTERQIIPYLGSTILQRLRPPTIQRWHETILTSGGKDDRPLSPRTVGHAHRVLHRALQRAVEMEILARNVASAISPPSLEPSEIEILDAGQIAIVLESLKGHDIYSIAALALATGMRRGELLALQWTDCDLDAATLTVERALEETRAGLRFKAPKTRHGLRTISLPDSAVQVLRDHRLNQLETRMALGLGRPESDALVFSKLDGTPMSPDNLSRDWVRICRSLKLPRVMFHALRHTHASALIAAGLDVVTISRRLGHAKPTTTLTVYGHLFSKTDEVAADAIEAAMRTDKGTDRG